jgi:hypothetical protein
MPLIAVMYLADLCGVSIPWELGARGLDWVGFGRMLLRQKHPFATGASEGKLRRAGETKERINAMLVYGFPGGILPVRGSSLFSVE